MAYTQETTTTVNHLLEVLNERIKGYEKAAKNTKEEAERTIFEQYSRQAKQFADELLPFSDKFNPEEVGTRIQGDVWHFWMDIKGTFTGKDEDAMIKASITGEKAAISNYEEALKKENLDSEIKGILSKQLSEIKSACEKLERMD